MNNGFELEVLTPVRALLCVAGVTKVRLRLADEAWLSIYPRHAPLVAETAGGVLAYDTPAESGELSIAPGILQVEGDKIWVLTSGTYSETAVAADTGADEVRFDRLARELMRTLATDVTPRMETPDPGVPR